MPVAPNPKVARSTLRFLEDGQQVQNGLYFLTAADFWIDEELEALGTAVKDWWDDNLRLLVSNTVTLVDVITESMATLADPGVIVPANLVGGVSSPALPNNVTCAVKLLTATGGRSGRGRLFHVGLTESAVAQNTIDSTIRTGLEAAYAEAIDITLDPAVSWVVYSQIFEGAPRTSGATRIITSVSIDPIIDSQRRRLPGRGR